MDATLADWLWYTIGLPSTCLTRESFLALAERILDAKKGFDEYSRGRRLPR